VDTSPIKAVVDQLVESGMEDDESLVGCSEENIQQIEQQFGLKLPERYVEFLKVMGLETANFLAGLDFGFPKLLSLRDRAEKLLTRCSPKTLLHASAFGFISNQGSAYLYFDSAANSIDPPVTLILDDGTAPRRVFDHFTDWLRQSLNEELDARPS
jgi:hypothetical protein